MMFVESFLKRTSEVVEKRDLIEKRNSPHLGGEFAPDGLSFTKKIIMIIVNK